MKTANEIITAIETKRENDRKEIVDWAIKLIDDASEDMLKRLKKTCILHVEFKDAYQMQFALSQPEVKNMLETNGFEVIVKDLRRWYITVKE